MADPNQPPAPRARSRELGLSIGRLPVGPTNTIVDVADVRVGHRTIWRTEPARPDGRGTARTGVTAIVPFVASELFASRVPAGAAVLNGAGEVIGITAIREWGVLETPIFLTSSMAMGRVYDGAVGELVDRIPDAGLDDALMPTVAECDDGHLNDSRTIQIEAADVRAALDAAAAGAEAADCPGVQLGVVGSGAGMVCFELKGGIGSASRLVRPMNRRAGRAGSGARRTPPDDGPTFNVGVLAMTNFGRLERLTIDGVAVGARLVDEGWPAAGGAVTVRADGMAVPASDWERGSCVVVVATDAPLTSHQLERLARRAGLGLARTGSTAGHGSGEIFLALSTGLRVPRRPADPMFTTATLHDEYLDPLFAAVVEATEEAVIDSLFVADTVVGRAGTTVPGLPVGHVLDLLRMAGRLG